MHGGTRGRWRGPKRGQVGRGVRRERRGTRGQGTREEGCGLGGDLRSWRVRGRETRAQHGTLLRGEVAVVIEFAGLAEGGEGFEDFLDAFDALGGGAAEGFGNVGGRGAGREGGDGGVDGAGLGRERFWPLRSARSELRGARFARGLFGFRTFSRLFLKREGEVVLAGGVLEVGAEVADEAAAFLGGALVVEGDEAGEDFVIGEVGGPAVGIGDGGIEVVVNLAKDRNEALFVDFLFLLRERLAGAEFFEDVVHAGHGERGMQRLLTFAVGVELFAEVANAGFSYHAGIRRRKCVKILRRAVTSSAGVVQYGFDQ